MSYFYCAPSELFWLYVLDTIDVFIVAFNSAIIDLGNIILKKLKMALNSNHSVCVYFVFNFCSFLTWARL